MSELIFSEYEFRPLDTSRKLLRYNNGKWIDDDGEWDVCFITDDNKGAPMCYYVNLPYKSNLMWSWVKDGNWGGFVSKHPNGNAWHYQSKDGTKDIWDGWDRDRHPNTIAGKKGMSKLRSKYGCANGSGVDLFHIGDRYIINGKVREVATKKLVVFPEKFECIYCGQHDLSKLKMEDQTT